MKVFLVFGTRPEAIKMCPLVLELNKQSQIDCVVCLTGQHRQMLMQVMEIFNVEADYNLEIMKDRQTLTDITISILNKIEPILEIEKPDIVLVHGDTTTSYAAALAAFYQKIPVGHVEAGLRTGNIYSPFPEEMNRVLIDRISTYFFAPTDFNKTNLIREGITDNIFVTGNTIIDSFNYTVNPDYIFNNKCLADMEANNKNVIKTENNRNKIILITAHRRENIGEPLMNICRAIERLAFENSHITFVFPTHLNPAVQDIVYNILGHIHNVLLTEPIDVLDMHNLISRCYFVMTDSGGIQEEAPYFGKPVLVLRKETERPEGVRKGIIKVVGVEEDSVYREASKLIKDNSYYSQMSHAVSPYGDGHACERIVETLLSNIVMR